MHEPTHLKLLRGGSNNAVGPAPDTAHDTLYRRGRLFDVVLTSLRDYARDADPDITVEEASHLLVEFPLFLSGLRHNLRGDGFVRELPNLPGY